MGCYNLTYVLLPQHLKKIPDYCFRYCNSLTYYEIRHEIESIGDYAFDGTGLKHIYISEKVTSIGKDAFGKNVEIITPEGSYASQWAQEHGNPTSQPAYKIEYEWKDDYSSVTAKRLCELVTSLSEFETVETTAEVIVPATCEGTGITTYTAEFKSPLFTTQTRTVEDIPALGHDWEEATYTWSEDNSEVTAKRVCKRADHPETETVKTTSEITVPATTEAEGKMTYTAVFANTAFATQTKVVDIPKLPKTYTVKVTNDGNGLGAADPDSGETGTVVTLVAAPFAGYQFREWQVISGGVTVTDNQFTIGMADVEVKAVFEKIPEPEPEPSPEPTPQKTNISKAKVTVKDQVYTGKKLTPKLTVKVGTKTLKLKTDYTVTFSNNKNVGKATVTITGKGDYTGTKTATFTILPKKVTLSKLEAGSKSLTVKWKTGKGIDGYQIEYSLKKNFSGSKKITVKGAKNKAYTIKKLKAKKTYYVRIRAWKKVKGKTYYSEWSKVLNRKTGK